MAICFLLAASTVLIYSPVGNHPFIHYDDMSYVVENPHVTAGLTWDTFVWALTATDASNWHPLTWISHALDCSVFGLNPAGHHWMNVVIHALNTVLLFLLLWRVTGARWKSLLVAALFGLHPLNVESVAWVAERKNVLCTLFFFLTLGAYGWYARKPDIRRYLLVALLFLLGLASKPMVITLPFVLMLVDYWPLGRIENWSFPSVAFPVPQFRASRLVLEKLPLLALSAASAIITMVAQTDAVIATQTLPLSVRLETSLYAYGVYVWKFFWPVHLALIYPHPGRTLPFWQVLVSALLIVSMLAVAWKERSSRPYIAVGWLWFLGTAVPIIGIVQVGVQVVADRYAYLPLIGIFLCVVWATAELLDRFRFGTIPRVVAASLIVGALGFMTVRQISSWESTEAVWKHALQVTQNNSLAESFLADELFLQGRYPEAMVHLRNYTKVEPFDPNAHARVGADFQDRGELGEAITEYEKAIRGATTLSSLGQPSLETNILAATYANLAICYAQTGDAGKAQENMRKAVETNSDAVMQLISDLANYLRQHPGARGYLRLGLLLQLGGHAEEAKQAFSRAMQLDPHLALPAISATF